MILSLEYLHNKFVIFIIIMLFLKIIYRDIKPENIMVDEVVQLFVN